MTRYFSQSRSYDPLDDTQDFNEDLNVRLNSMDNEFVTDEVVHSVEGVKGFGKLVLLVKRARIPRINFAYIEARCGAKKRKTICDVVICLFTLVTILSICVGLGYHAIFVQKPSLVIDKSYQAFRIPYHEASLSYGALEAAKKNYTSFSHIKMKNLGWLLRPHKRSAENKKFGDRENSNQFAEYNTKFLNRRKRSGNTIVLNAPTQYYPEWKMQVVFVTDGDKNIFTKENLLRIHEIEKKIISHQNFSDFCFKDDMHATIVQDPAVKALNGCAPLNSLMTYFFPSKDATGNIYYDGLGDNMDNIDSALKLAMTSDHFYYYVDDKINSTYKKSQLIRTEVLFGAPLKGFTHSHTDREKQKQIFKDFVVSYIDVLSKQSTDDISVLYGGQEIFDYEVEMTFWNDVKLAIYAFVAIFLLMLILTSGSIWLTIWGLIAILLSAPLALFFYRVVFKVIGLGILNGAAAFVIIGIGVDDVFVFINVFRQADHVTDPMERTLYTMKTAGKATFFTSFTTAAAFAANIASMIPAVHDFGLFMSLIVANCWITVMIVMPPVLYIWYISFWKCESKLANIICWCVPQCLCNNLTLPSDVAHFMDKNHGSTMPVTLTPEVVDEDDEDDVPMLSMDPRLQYIDNDDDDDDEMVIVDAVVTDNDVEKSKSHLGAKLQAVLYYCLALPVIKIRWIILGLSFILLCVSIGLMTQLQTSTKPPQFFKANTNIQKLLDLKSKFSAIDTVKCYDCSAIYSIDQSGPAVHPVTNPPKTHPPRTQPPKTQSPPTRPPTTPRPSPLTKQHAATVKTTTKAPPITVKPDTTTAKPRSHTHNWKPIPPAPSYPPRPAHTDKPTPKSVPEDYDVCKHSNCGTAKNRPLLESGATVYLIVGLEDFTWRNQDLGHVMADNVGEVKYDKRFSQAFNFSNPGLLDSLKQLCHLCKLIANNSHLVRNGSAQCLPTDSMPYQIVSIIESIDECKDLPKTSYIYHSQQPAHAIGGLTNDGTAVLWLGFAFESTTSKSKSYFEAFKEYEQWEEFITKVKKELPSNSPLKDMFQTSEFWPEVLMEIVAVNSAIYSVVLSMVICMIAVLLFTRHIRLLLVVFISITEMVCLVVGIFYVVGWEIGGVEAISLSILVGSSVDYCVHLVEGYILAANACPYKDNASKAKKWRTGATLSHIGVSIISSALTTIIAAVPLTRTTIQPFAKFGQIIAINTSVCILYSLTVCTALLSTMAPAFFTPTWKSTIKAVIGTTLFIGGSLLTMFVMSKAGIEIPGPNGGSLFPK
ncbi:GRB10 interacting GYF protein 1 [Mactra antiquata]